MPIAGAPEAGAQVFIPELPSDLKRILIRLPNWLGDIVMAAPTVAAIAAARPEAELVAQVKAPFLPLAELLPGVRRAVPAGRDANPADLLRSRRTLRRLDLDAAVILPRSTRAALAPRLAGIPIRLGYGRRGSGRLLTHAVTGWRPYRRAHRSAWFGLLGRALGAGVGAPWLLKTPAAALAAADRLLLVQGHRPGRKLVVLEPGASYGPAKCWPARRFGALAARFHAAGGVNVVTVGLRDAREREKIVVAGAGGHVLCTAGKTPDVLTLVGLLARADLVISNDTGPMHLAAAVGTPTLALFGATDPAVSSPLGRGTRRLLYDPEPCSPCFLRTCPIPWQPCLTKIGVASVYRAAREMLDDTPQDR